MVDGIYGGVELKSIQNLKGEVQHRQHATLLVGFEIGRASCRERV